jgi:hypothetical protein
VPSDPERLSNLPLTVALLVERCDLAIPRQPLLTSCSALQLHLCWRTRRACASVLLLGRTCCCSGFGGHRFGRSAQHGMVTNEDPLHHLRQVLFDVPSVGNLDRLWSTASDAIGVGAGSITTDDLNFLVPAEPGGQGRCRPIWQQVDDPMLLQIDEDRAVFAALAPGPVVHAEHSHQFDRW